MTSSYKEIYMQHILQKITILIMYIFITETPKYYYTSLSTLFIPCKILFNIFAYLELQS